MQSLASLMSVKPSDVGNLDDFAESDEEEANGPGAPEARARVPQSGGLTACHALRPPRPRRVGNDLGHKPLAVLGQSQLVHTQRWELTVAQAAPTCPVPLIVQTWPLVLWWPGSLAESCRMGSQCLPVPLALSSLLGRCPPSSVAAHDSWAKSAERACSPVSLPSPATLTLSH